MANYILMDFLIMFKNWLSDNLKEYLCRSVDNYEFNINFFHSTAFD